MSESTPTETGLSALLPACIGGAIGAAFYFIVGRGILYLFWGPKGMLLSGRPEYEYGLPSGNVLSSPINLLSLVAFGIAMALLVQRWRQIGREQRGFTLGILGDDEDALLLPEDALEARKRLRQLDNATRRLTLVALLEAGLQRARANWSAEDCGQAVKTQAELIQGQTEADYSIIRYLAWAIPSIGFIGTVLGIGRAMGFLQVAKGEDMMTTASRHLGMAFDTTFVALVLSLILMYLLHRVQSADDTLLVRAIDWCMRRFVFRMHIPQRNQQ